jgi:putative transposase
VSGERIEAEKAQHGVAVSRACELLGVSRSGYQKWLTRPPSDRALSDAWLTAKIKEIHQENRGVDGAARVHAELRMQHGVHVGRKRVERLMRLAGLSGLVPNKRGRTTVRVPGVRVADDLVKRTFRPDGPDVLWIADLTYLRTWEGWLYLAAVQDAYSRRIVGWSMADHMRQELVIDALTMAVSRRRPAARGHPPFRPGLAICVAGVRAAVRQLPLLSQALPCPPKRGNSSPQSPVPQPPAPRSCMTLTSEEPHPRSSGR